jgi:hypothetical protein
MRILLLAALALTACGPSDGDSGPGGVTQGEARQLDEAAAASDINATLDDNAQEPAR